MNIASNELNLSGKNRSHSRSSWPLSRWLLLIALVLAAHLALIFTFGGRKPITPRVASNVPELSLATEASAWLALNNPTLFALPNVNDFAWRAWLEPPHLEFKPRDDWTENPRYLSLPVGELGAVFSQFMQTNRFTTFRFKLRPPPEFSVPLAPLEPPLAKTSTLRIEGDLAQRQLLTRMKLSSWPATDIIAPSRVQVLVNAAGNVISAVLLPSNHPGPTAGVRDAAADQRALELARAARFAPASGLTIGNLIFDWCTIVPPATKTNSPPVD